MLGACVQDRQLFVRQWLQIGILADLLFLLRFAWICYSGPNLLFPATRVKWSNTKVGGLWIKARIISKYFCKLKHLWPVIYESQSLNFKQQAKGRDPNSRGSFCRPRLVLVKLTDADGVVSIADGGTSALVLMVTPVLWRHIGVR